MSKHKKTLKEKLLAEKRRQDFFSSLQTTQTLSLSSFETSMNKENKEIMHSHPSYDYVKHDLVKTTLITSAIIALQIILFLFSKTHPLYKMF